MTDAIDESNAEVKEFFVAQNAENNPAPPEAVKSPEAEAKQPVKSEEVSLSPEKPEKKWADKYETPEFLEQGYVESQKELNRLKAETADLKLGVAAANKAKEAFERLQQVAVTAKPEELQSAILEVLKDSGDVSFDTKILDPDKALHLASVLNPLFTAQNEKIARLEAKLGIQPEPEPEYDAKYPHMVQAEVKDAVSNIVEELRAKSSDGSVDGDELAAAAVKIGLDMGAKVSAEKVAAASRIDPQASIHTESTPATKLEPDSQEAIKLAIFGDAKKGIEGVGETPPDFYAGG